MEKQMGTAHSRGTMTFATPAALLVIDAQASFTQRPCFHATGLAEYLAAQTR
jgi:hypothetical protein